MICRLNEPQYAAFVRIFREHVYEIREIGPKEEGITYVDAEDKAWVLFAILEDLPESEDPADQELADYIREVCDAEEV